MRAEEAGGSGGGGGGARRGPRASVRGGGGGGDRADVVEVVVEVVAPSRWPTSGARLIFVKRLGADPLRTRAFEAEPPESVAAPAPSRDWAGAVEDVAPRDPWSPGATGASSRAQRAPTRSRAESSHRHKAAPAKKTTSGCAAAGNAARTSSNNATAPARRELDAVTTSGATRASSRRAAATPSARWSCTRRRTSPSRSSADIGTQKTPDRCGTTKVEGKERAEERA